MDIAGASAIVTGGASGLGRATARKLYDAGASVVVVDLPQSEGLAYTEELGGNARFVPGDVTDPDQMQAAVEAAMAAGPLRVAVNCAGIATPGRNYGVGVGIGPQGQMGACVPRNDARSLPAIQAAGTVE